MAVKFLSQRFKMVVSGGRFRSEDIYSRRRYRNTESIEKRSYINSDGYLVYSLYSTLYLSCQIYAASHIPEGPRQSPSVLYISLSSFYLSFGIRPGRPLTLRCNGKEVRNVKQKVPKGRKIRCRETKTKAKK